MLIRFVSLVIRICDYELADNEVEILYVIIFIDSDIQSPA